VSLVELQSILGVDADGQWGPATKSAFMAAMTNTNAPAITPADIEAAATKLGCSTAHIRMIRKVESGGKSYDDAGRPVILFEPHIFSKRTSGRYDAAHPDISYPKWGAKPYPKGFDARWDQMCGAVALAPVEGLESASWGAFQIMGFHWHALGYDSALQFAFAMVASEGDHLDAVCRFIIANNLTAALRSCRSGNPDSCRGFARGYNGSGYEKNRYHVRMAEALA
jgi:hypothetical protein